ncbi:Response regulator receiver domain-containing protein [Algoriphagus locisalis]|uniref:Response regulator receiver domain-containing protein n=1 Tax=Algoriphagus locisalis TaxID=305507 RepID=A0A1I7DWN1_9BACT|nr:response regulator [Algoriphagus locisalis]SFU16071.1 Response regulator receiver domain-containing protein [Algoriphagus locisalis]
MNEKLTIFYTDDDIDDLEFFKSIVKMITDDYAVVTHMNGDQLLYALDNPPPNPHLLFLDINMPGMSGLEVLQTLRRSERHATLPIIMFSTTKDELIIEKTRELGANYYLPKAENFKLLRKSIEHTLNINWSDFIADHSNYLYNNN